MPQFGRNRGLPYGVKPQLILDVNENKKAKTSPRNSPSTKHATGSLWERLPTKKPKVQKSTPVRDLLESINRKSSQARPNDDNIADDPLCLDPESPLPATTQAKGNLRTTLHRPQGKIVGQEVDTAPDASDMTTDWEDIGAGVTETENHTEERTEGEEMEKNITDKDEKEKEKEKESLGRFSGMWAKLRGFKSETQ